MKSKVVTAAELLETLGKDVAYQEMMRWKSRALHTFNRMLVKDQRPLAKAVRKCGFPIQTIWDLVNTAAPYPEAIPVLLEHIKKDYHPKTKEGIARALTVSYLPEGGWEVLHAQYLGTTSDEEIQDPQMRGYKNGLAVALSNAADASRLNCLIDIIKNRGIYSGSLKAIF